MRILIGFFIFIVLNVILVKAYRQTNGKICKPESARNSSIDDVPAISRALSECGDGGTIIIPEGEIFAIRTPLSFNKCNGCEVQLEGTLKVSEDLHYWESRTIFFIENISGSKFHSLTGSGVFDGSGQIYWDYFGVNKTYQRPPFIHINNVSNSVFTHLKFKDSPWWFITINGSSTNLTFSELVLSAVSKSSHEPINTDGIDTCECSHITIRNVHITNDDDCVCFKNGSNYITVDNVTCVSSRGISVGSLGYSHGLFTVQNVYASNIKMINSQSAARIKVFPGGPRHGPVIVSNVTIENLTSDNSQYAFRVQTCYSSSTSECEEYPSAAIISNVKLINFTGTTSTKYDPDVANINCPPKGTCDLTFVGWNVTSPSKNSTVLCNHYDHPSGVVCTPGAFG